MSEFARRSLLTYQDTHPVVLDLYLLNAFGPEWYDWDPNTVWAEAIRVTGSPNVSEVNRHKIQAIRAVHMTNASFRRWELFEKIIAAFNGVVPRFDIVQKPDLGQLLSGVDSMITLRQELFSDEVTRYIAAAVMTDGVFWVPDPLTFVNPFLKARQPELHEAVGTARGKKGAHVSEAMQVQLDRVADAESYFVSRSKALLEQTGVLRAA